jgi:uncharacterized protein (DUF1015 family)
MALIRPFSGWRYAAHGTDLSAVVAPPYDVISSEQREALLARDRHNVVGLELPDGPLVPEVAGNRYEHGRATWQRWRETGVLAVDEAPCVYVLEQTYAHEGRTVRRRAFIVEVGLEPFSAGVVLPHERTLPKALGDRFELIRATGANFSQVFGLFDDVSCESDALFERAMASDPTARAVDDDGVSSRLWACDDPAIATELARLLADRQIFIADGHHRYTTALAYRDLRREAAGAPLDAAPGGAAYDYVMMALVNMDDPDLEVLPTHRVADAPGSFEPESFKAALRRWFTLDNPVSASPSDALRDITEPAFLFQTAADQGPLLARLRPDVSIDEALPLDVSTAWKHLDVAVLQELVLNPLLDIHPDRPDTLDRLRFVKDPRDALAAIGRHDVAFLLRPTRLEQLRSVALAGETMPQKSTYFYPKLPSGLVFRSAE